MSSSKLTSSPTICPHDSTPSGFPLHHHRYARKEDGIFSHLRSRPGPVKKSGSLYIRTTKASRSERSGRRRPRPVGYGRASPPHRQPHEALIASFCLTRSKIKRVALSIFMVSPRTRRILPGCCRDRALPINSVILERAISSAPGSTVRRCNHCVRIIFSSSSGEHLCIRPFTTAPHLAAAGGT